MSEVYGHQIRDLQIEVLELRKLIKGDPQSTNGGGIQRELAKIRADLEAIREQIRLERETRIVSEYQRDLQRTDQQSRQRQIQIAILVALVVGLGIAISISVAVLLAVRELIPLFQATQVIG